MFNFPDDRRVRLAFREDIEPHETLLDSLAKQRESEGGFSERKFEVPLVKKILQGFFIFSLLLISSLFLKTFQLQIIQGQEFSVLAQENKFIINQIRAERGVIYDRDLEQLVSNLPSFDLVLDIDQLPQEEGERDSVLKEVVEIVERELEDIKIEIEEAKTNQILVAEDLPHQQLILLEAKIKNLPGFQINNNTIREYQEGLVFSHLIGYTGKIKSEELKSEPELYSINDYVGRTGIESSYEEILRKNPGKLRIERDALGNVLSKEIISLPESGKSLVLWMDADLQRKIKEELEKELNILGSKSAVGVALDPKTGGVLSLVSLPGFNNNLFQKGADPEELQRLLEDSLGAQPLFNRAVSGRYLTGSTIKPLIASAVLEEEIIDPEKSIHCTGKIVIPNPWVLNASSTKDDWTVHGWTDMKKAIAESCNVYFYTTGGGLGDQEGLGPTRIKEYLQLFGWEEITEIDIPGEAKGFVPDKYWKKETWDQSWWDGDTYNLSIGQGFLQITPLEVVNSFAAIANGGTLYQPRVVKEIIDQDKNLIEEIEPTVIRQNFINSENLQIVREGMRQAVTGVNSPQASAISLSSLPVAVAAKTGTAELGEDSWGIEHYHNWVTVFAPYEDPEIVLTIMMEDIKGVQAAALPVARAVLEWYFTR